MKPVPNFPGYFVTKDGEVHSARTNYGRVSDTRRALKLDWSTGYARVSFSIKGRGKVVRHAVHRLVLKLFVGPPPTPNHEAMHLDGNPRNNNVTNLAWGTASENNLQKLQHGTWQGGEANGEAKVTAKQVKQIRLLASEGTTRKALVKAFGISKTQVARIVKGVSWKHLLKV